MVRWTFTYLSVHPGVCMCVRTAASAYFVACGIKRAIVRDNLLCVATARLRTACPRIDLYRNKKFLDSLHTRTFGLCTTQVRVCVCLYGCEQRALGRVCAPDARNCIATLIANEHYYIYTVAVQLGVCVRRGSCERLE